MSPELLPIRGVDSGVNLLYPQYLRHPYIPWGAGWANVSDVITATRPDEPALAGIIRPAPLLFGSIPSVRHPLADLLHLLDRVAGGQVVECDTSCRIRVGQCPLLLGESGDPTLRQDVRHRQGFVRVRPPGIAGGEGQCIPHHCYRSLHIAVAIGESFAQLRVGIPRWFLVVDPVLGAYLGVDLQAALFENAQIARRGTRGFSFRRRKCFNFRRSPLVILFTC